MEIHSSRLCAFALKISRQEYAAPTGLDLFWDWVLQRCRAYGAKMDFTMAGKQSDGQLYLPAAIHDQRDIQSGCSAGQNHLLLRL